MILPSEQECTISIASICFVLSACFSFSLVALKPRIDAWLDKR
jgi:hypothetical protein